MEPPENRDLDVETDDATSLIDADVEGHIETQNGVDSDQRGGTTKEFLSNKGFGWLLEVDDADIDTSKSLLEELDVDPRDIMRKLGHVIFPFRSPEQKSSIRDNADFWGPLLVVVAYAVVSLYGQFRVVSWIITIWLVGSFIIFLLARVLGGEVQFGQCLSVIGYSLLPLIVTGSALFLVIGLPLISLLTKSAPSLAAVRSSIPLTQMIESSESMYDSATNACVGTTTRENLKLPLPVSAPQSSTATTATAAPIASPFGGLALTTPDLENFITASSLAISTSCTTPTPTPTTFLKAASSQATTEQEEYVRGFVAALQRIQEQESSANPVVDSSTTSSMSSLTDATSTTYATNTNYPIMSTMTTMTAAARLPAPPTQSYATTSIASSNLTPSTYDEGTYGYYKPSGTDSLVNNLLLAAAATEQIVPGTPPPPPNPLDPQYQEELKKRRKKERNRVAASKCRKRRLEREADLEEKVKAMKVEYGELTSEATRLRQVVFKLKQLVMAHVNGGCSVMMEQAGLAPAAVSVTSAS